MSAVQVSPAALAAASGHLRVALPAETGGILVGWRTREKIVVTEMLPVPDKSAGGHHYQREHLRAQHVLHQHLREQHNPLVGYVGEWHTHPAPQPPSSLDRRSLRDIAADANGPVGMAVLAYNSTDDSITVHVCVAQQNRRRGGSTARASLRSATLSIAEPED